MRLRSAGQLGVLLGVLGWMAISQGDGVGAKDLELPPSTPGAMELWESSVSTLEMIDGLLAVTRECKYHCRDCGQLLDRHEIIEATENNSTAIHLETCNPQTCQESGHLCPGSLAWSEEMGDELEAMMQDASGVRFLMAHGLNVEFNVHRGHMQLFGCEGEVLASVPAVAVE